ncbi:phosphoglycerate dehydrogenase [Adlercreutzia caecimuris]|jgi:D-3-phosphoglycerate dehydrogenase|uniref:phosphoglycerate dehydrogenase n=1 Tax=Adlercreutzia caecimuris TaxID=671266 RepID=UPI002570E13D|nr:phosphoglycerate dehydrogenase [Adlercreutzia caecimuris]
MAKKILVTEDLVQEGIDALVEQGYEVDVLIDPTADELMAAIAPYDALIVHPNTVVDAALLDAAKNLKIVGRAGVTVDNIDVEAASERGVIVCNAPTSNVISAAEHTMALLLAAARRIPEASASMHAGQWRRGDFMGSELYGKTLAIFGLGRVGGLVAERAAAFGMNLIGHDPYCSPERALHLGVTLYEDMAPVLAQADFITVHLPRTVSTLGMFGADEFAAMKDGVVLVNAARGGIFNMEALADFVAAGKVAGVAIDSFESEPCTSSPLHEFAGAILTPHLSPMTHEAQRRASTQIAEYVAAGLEGGMVATAVNLAPLPPEAFDIVGPYIHACKMLGSVASQLLGHTPKNLKLELAGAIADADPAPLLAAVLDGGLSYRRLGAFSAANAESVASRHGISVTTASVLDAQEYASSVRVVADEVEVAATLFGTEHTPRIISLLDYKIDMAPGTTSLVFEYVDAPGRIGTIGTILGEAGANITTMQIGTKPAESCALVYMNVEGDVGEAVLDRLRDAIDLRNLWKIVL